MSCRWAFGRKRPLLLALAVLVLAGCAGPARRPADVAALRYQAEREARLAAVEAWGLSGRLAVSHGRDSGNGRLDWVQDGPDMRLELRAPVSGRGWRLVVEHGRARLEGLDGGPREGGDAAELLRRELGWTLPFAELGSWVRGARGGPAAVIEFAQDGLPARIHEHGWTIDYRGWDRDRTPPLPSRVFAQHGEQRVRLAVERWTAGEP